MPKSTGQKGGKKRGVGSLNDHLVEQITNPLTNLPGNITPQPMGRINAIKPKDKSSRITPIPKGNKLVPKHQNGAKTRPQVSKK